MERIARSGVEIEVYRGFHGITCGIMTTLDMFDNPGEKIGPNYVAQVLGYLSLVRTALSCGHPEIIVYEDDVTFPDDYPELLARTLEQAPADWEILYLGYGLDAAQPKRPGAFVKYDRPWGAYGIALRQSAMEKMIDRLDSCGTPIDISILNRVLPVCRYYCVGEPICGHLNQLPQDNQYPTTSLGSSSWKEIDGWMDFEDIYREQVQRIRSGVIVEVGSWLGRSAALMGTLIKQSHRAINFYAIDTFQGTASDPHMSRYGGAHDVFREFEINMVNCGVRNYVHPIRSDSAEAAVLFADHSIDFCFIDANHDRGACLRDVRAWLPKIKYNGVLAGHDIDFDTVLADMDESGITYEIRGRSWIHFPSGAPHSPFHSREELRLFNDAREVKR